MQWKARWRSVGVGALGSGSLSGRELFFQEHGLLVVGGRLDAHRCESTRIDAVGRRDFLSSIFFSGDRSATCSVAEVRLFFRAFVFPGRFVSSFDWFRAVFGSEFGGIGSFKLPRASGGCLGAERRRRTRSAAKRSGELQKSDDPEVSEWGNPARVMPGHPLMNT